MVATTRDQSRGDHYHSWPQWLGGGRLLFFVRTDKAETNGTYAGSLDSTAVTKVMASGTRAQYPSGKPLWIIDDRLVAQPFDPSGLRLSGQAETVVPSVFQGAGRTPGFWTSAAGTLAYTSGDTRERQFQWIDRTGTALQKVGGPGLLRDIESVSGSVEDRRRAQQRCHGAVWMLSLLDAARGAFAPLTVGDQDDSDPRFGPDNEVVFARNSRESSGVTQMDPANGRLTTLLPRGKLPVIWLEDWGPTAARWSIAQVRTATRGSFSPIGPRRGG